MSRPLHTWRATQRGNPACREGGSCRGLRQRGAGNFCLRFIEGCMTCLGARPSGEEGGRGSNGQNAPSASKAFADLPLFLAAGGRTMCTGILSFWRGSASGGSSISGTRTRWWSTAWRRWRRSSRPCLVAHGPASSLALSVLQPPTLPRTGSPWTGTLLVSHCAPL